MFVIAADGTVCHVLPGFWHPDDLARELKFALELVELWGDESVPPSHKRAVFAAAQHDELSRQPRETYLRSGWQGFDAKNEQKRIANGIVRDTIEVGADGHYVENKSGKLSMKTINVIVHERLASRPFLAFEQFDTAVFADYGRKYYDNNKKVDGAGITFMTPKRVEKQEAREAKIAAKKARTAEKAQKRAKARAAMAEARRQKKQRRGSAEKEEEQAPEKEPVLYP